MDGDMRYAAIREQIAAQHEIARLERAGRAAGTRRKAAAAGGTWSSGLSGVVGTVSGALIVWAMKRFLPGPGHEAPARA